ncbi:uncharacterized protein A1O5_04365 [Cladophialophora psammophila CBS 110553]|uniref:Asl1-like glycosyl hydrolase catalytic domain-containing protein n=1 Tax=Cladophialophora psammophila CBS 110553 TaxID=1182543 RepID=W9XNF6_9EURO|nr:uncharacterized protein A1O5_04365 [Cladophialophora psammophila CBS 110553]EXJ71864.1 hypothetical protein A1O5_04365 [Cladophialophora psammophila CBS 110553]
MQKSRPPPPPPKPKSLSSNLASSNANSRSRKRGLGWPWDQPSTHFALYQSHAASGKISWIFNWECWIPDSVPAELEWIPCVRTAANARDQLDPFLTDIIQNRRIKTTALLGFNEPEILDQANLSAEEAAKLWTDVVLPAKRKFNLRLGSPGMSSDVSRSKPWLNSFLSLLDGKHEIDFLVVHWYGLHFADMRAFLEDIHATYGLPLWVNEFACSRMGNGDAGIEEVEAFMREAVPWLEGCEWVEKYAYFGNKDVGAWVGKASNFTEEAAEATETDGRRLTRVGRLYCTL